MNASGFSAVDPFSAGDAQDYSSDDVQQILTLALGRDSSSLAQLKEMAEELSIDDATLGYAVDVWRSRKAKAQKKLQRRQRFYRQELLPYLMVNGFLLLLDAFTTGGITWSIYPLLGWGLGLLLGVGGCPLLGWGFGMGGCDRKRQRRAEKDSGFGQGETA